MAHPGNPGVPMPGIQVWALHGGEDGGDGDRERVVKGLGLLLCEQGGIRHTGTIKPVETEAYKIPKGRRMGRPCCPQSAPVQAAWARQRWLLTEFGSAVELLPQDTGYTKANTGSRTCSWWRHLLWITTCTKSPVPSSGPCRLGAPGEHTGHNGVVPCSWALQRTLH